MSRLIFLQPGQLGIVDVLDILVVAVLIYRILLVIRGTRGMQVTLGIIFLALLYYGSRLAQLRTSEPAAPGTPLSSPTPTRIVSALPELVNLSAQPEELPRRQGRGPDAVSGRGVSGRGWR